MSRIANLPARPPSRAAADERAVIYVFRRGPSRRSCETRLSAEGPGYELVVRETDGPEQVERFTALADMLSREHELRQAWRAQGWHDTVARRPRSSTPPK